jgi:Na+-translocating ferredoxin:NAD+ oxidoreductase RnfA subunit
MLTKLVKLLAIGLGMLVAVVMLCALRFVMMARDVPDNTAIDIVALIHSPWMMLGFAAIVGLAVWTTYEWVIEG